MRSQATLRRFKAFCERFVHSYWNDIAVNGSPLPGGEPSGESVEQLLREIEYSYSLDDDAFTLHMIQQFRSEWVFTFGIENDRWVVQSAISTSSNGHRLDWLAGPCSSWFVDFLQRVIDKAQSPVAKGTL